jgi:hypothetical protein
MIQTRTFNASAQQSAKNSFLAPDRHLPLRQITSKSLLQRTTQPASVKNGCKDFGYIHPDAFNLISSLVADISHK